MIVVPQSIIVRLRTLLWCLRDVTVGLHMFGVLPDMIVGILGPKASPSYAALWGGVKSRSVFMTDKPYNF